MVKIKSECDIIVYKGVYWLVQGGFVVFVGWWGIVYYVIFYIDVGWDLVELVIYLVGLIIIMGGYLWFFYISKDFSYKVVMNVMVIRCQNVLY